MIDVIQQQFAIDVGISLGENIICRAVLHKISLKVAITVRNYAAVVLHILALGVAAGIVLLDLP